MFLSGDADRSRSCESHTFSEPHAPAACYVTARRAIASAPKSRQAQRSLSARLLPFDACKRAGDADGGAVAAADTMTDANAFSLQVLLANLQAMLPLVAVCRGHVVKFRRRG
eukprot:6189415-Pleurochrysis_carterae.AAC.3